MQLIHWLPEYRVKKLSSFYNFYINKMAIVIYTRAICDFIFEVNAVKPFATLFKIIKVKKSY